MRILLASHFFHPSIGGIERVSLMLAREFARLGHDVRVVTQTAEESGTDFPFRVVRRPGVGELLRQVRWCEVCFHNNVALRLAWPLLLLRRPWVVAHHMWITRADGTLGWRDRGKRWVLRRAATSIGGSEAMARDLGWPMQTIPNPFDASIFIRDERSARAGEIVFVGRLVSDKGADLLLTALTLPELARVRVTIVGSGPEEAALRQQVRASGLEERVTFVGSKSPTALAETLNAHRVLAMPSRRAEPFGVAALEGLACGCVVVGSSEGGLPEAIGPGGVIFPNGDVPALAAALARALAMDAAEAEFRRAVQRHLERHQPTEVAKAYLAVFERARAEGTAKR